MKRINVTLENNGGELDSRTLAFSDIIQNMDPESAMAVKILEVIKDWKLGPGDIIRIAELPS